MGVLLTILVLWLGSSFVYYWFIPVVGNLKYYLIPVWILAGLVTMLILFTALVYFLAWTLSFAKPNSKLRWSYTNWLTSFALMMSNTHVKVIDYEKKTKDSPVLFVANHKSQLDPLFLFKYIKGPYCIAAKSTLNKVVFIRPFFKALQVLLIDRDNDRATMKVILKGIDYMRNGANCVIFPEGGIKTREVEQMVEIKPGCYKLATKSNATIQPIVIRGNATYGKKRLFERKDITIQFLDPITPEEYKDLETRDIALKVFDMVNGEIKDEQRIYYDPENKAY